MTIDPQLASWRPNRTSWRSSAQQPRVAISRALRERRTMRQLQAASHVFFWRRWAAAAAAACPTQLGQLPRASGGFCAPSSSPRAPAPAPAPALPPPPASEPTTTATRPVAAAAAAAPTTSAEAYFRSLLRSRGRSVAATRLAFRQPTPKQVHDYGLKPFVSDLARKGDIEGLQKAMEAGRGMVSQVRTHAGVQRILHNTYAECFRTLFLFLVQLDGDVFGCPPTLTRISWAVTAARTRASCCCS